MTHRSPRPPLIVGNWKMHGLIAQAAAIAAPLRRGADGLACEMVVCPPATVLQAVAVMLVGSAVGVGGQDCHPAPQGAYTGDISAEMLRDAGASWVIVGHSERRAQHGETDAIVRQKVEAALRAGLHPIVCVGETAAERRDGHAAAVVERQVAGSLPPRNPGAVGELTIAYEPVWAIGTGHVPTPAEIADVHAVIRHAVGPQLRILYGGSVNAANAATLLAVANVDGALVGGASLDPAAFLAIAAAADALSKAAGGG